MRCRPGSAGSARRSGASPRTASGPTSSPSGSRWATGIRWEPSSRRQPSPHQFAERWHFFSTFAGSPVAAAVGTAVLDVIERERLAEQAERVGAYLRMRLTEVALVACGHQRRCAGPGLFIGVELDCDASGRADHRKKVVANGPPPSWRSGRRHRPTGQCDQDPPAARLLRRGMPTWSPRHSTRPWRQRCDDRQVIDTADVLTDELASFWRIWSASSAGAEPSCSSGGPQRPSASSPASCPTSCPRPRTSARPTGASPDARRSPTGGSRSPGPLDRKMVINALNSGARVFMADFEDSNSPTWSNARRAAQPHRRARPDDLARHRREAVRARRRSGGAVRAAARLAPRGAALRGRRRADLGLALRLRPLLLPQPRPQRPLLLPAEARVPPRGAALERRLRLVAGAARVPRGTIRATVLIETILAAFEMDEILTSCATTPPA